MRICVSVQFFVRWTTAAAGHHYHLISNNTSSMCNFFVIVIERDNNYFVAKVDAGSDGNGVWYRSDGGDGVFFC